MSFWVDHASSFVYFLFHSSKAAAELVYSKAKFEQFLACFNVQIRNFRLDNGVYSAQLFCNSYLWHQQHLFFCGVATHWQNRTAEHFIGTVTQQAWTILLHATAKWSLVIKEEMWSFALWHTVNFHNYSVWKQQTKTPYELFTGQVPSWSLSGFWVFGPPTYILHKALQDGSSHGKWKSRAWLGIYVGISNCHSSAIPLIYNPESTHISPQYHMVYDEYFMTVAPPPTFDSKAYLDKLYQTSARWLHCDECSDAPHYLDSFWGPANQNSRKRSLPDAMQIPSRGSSEQPDPLPTDTMHIPLRGSSEQPAPSPLQLQVLLITLPNKSHRQSFHRFLPHKGSKSCLTLPRTHIICRNWLRIPPSKTKNNLSLRLHLLRPILHTCQAQVLTLRSRTDRKTHLNTQWKPKPAMAKLTAVFDCNIYRLTTHSNIGHISISAV